MRKYKQVKEKKVTYDLDEWEEVERRARKMKMKTGTYIISCFMTLCVVKFMKPIYINIYAA